MIVGVSQARPSRAVLALLLAAAVLVPPQVGAPPAAHAAATVVSVRDFGATGDGATNDTGPIRNAVKAGTAPRTVVFPAGSYVFSDVYLGSDTAVVFEPGARAVAPTTATAGVFFAAPATEASRVQRVSVHGGDFDGRGVLTAVFATTFGDYIDIKGVDASNVTRCVATDRTTHVTVRDCSVRNALFGYAFEESEYVDVSDCRSSRTTRDGIIFYGHSRFCTATANVIEDYMTVDSDGVGGIHVYGSTDATVTGNVILDGHHNSAGVRFRDAERFWCEGNYVVSPGSSGYQVHRVGDYPGLDGGDGTFIGNTVVGAHLRGVDVPDPRCKPVRVIGNVVLDTTSVSPVSAGMGIVVAPAGSAVVGNRVEVATGAGIQVDSAHQVVGGNLVHDVASINFGPRVGVFVTGTEQAVVANAVSDELGHMLNGVRQGSGSVLLRDNVIAGAAEADYDLRGTTLSSMHGDLSAPAVTCEVLSNLPSTAVLRLSASDAVSAVPAVRVSIDGAPDRWLAGPSAEVTVAGAGNHAVRYAAIDAVGNVSATGTESLVVPAGGRAASAAPTLAISFVGTDARTASPPGGETIEIVGSLREASGVPLVSTSAVELQRLDGVTWTAAALLGPASGSVVHRFPATQAASYRLRFPGDGAHPAAVSDALRVKPVSFTPVEGADRIGTAVAASKAAFAAGSAEAVVICTAYGFPDALGGSVLAGAVRGPLLLTGRDSLPAAVSDEIARTGARKAYVVGSRLVVSDAVAARLASLLAGADRVERIGGANRYETAAKVASATSAKLAAAGRPFDGTVLIATGANFPDALAASPVAAAKGWPILLASSTLPDSSLAALRALAPTRAIVLGSDRAVPAAVVTRLGLEIGAANVSRLQGPSRYQTAAEIAKFGVQNGMRWDGVALATGENYPDALSGGVMQARLGSVVLLTPTRSLDPTVRSVLASEKSGIGTVRFLGGPTALSAEVRASVVSALR